MINRLLRWTHWRARARYWRVRCIRAEAQLEAEHDRNQEREDTLLTVPVRMLGMMGMAPRSGPASLRQQPAMLSTANPWESLNWQERNEFDSIVWPNAQVHNIPRAQAQQDFLEMVRRRKLNDDLSM